MFTNNALISEMDHLRRFALKLTRNIHDAEDLLHSTMVRALEKRHMFTQDTNLFKWTSKIMYNMFVSEYRRKTKFETQYDPETYIERMSVEATQESEMEFKQTCDAMQSLSEDHRQILVMICIKGMQYAEVAEALDIPVGTVRSRLSRARETLQNLMDAGMYHGVEDAAEAVARHTNGLNTGHPANSDTHSMRAANRHLAA